MHYRSNSQSVEKSKQREHKNYWIAARKHRLPSCQQLAVDSTLFLRRHGTCSGTVLVQVQVRTSRKETLRSLSSFLLYSEYSFWLFCLESSAAERAEDLSVRMVTSRLGFCVLVQVQPSTSTVHGVFDNTCTFSRSFFITLNKYLYLYSVMHCSGGF